MAIVLPSDVAGIYNHVWAEAGSHATLAGGILLYAKDNPWALRRWGKNDTAIIWTMDFNWHRDPRGDLTLFVYGKRSDFKKSWDVSGEKGSLTVVKVKGDLDQFQKDWVLLKMFEHEWRES